MQAQVLSAVVNRVKIVKTINYGQKYITDLKYVNKGMIIVSVENTKGTDPSSILRDDSIPFLSTYGSCLCYTNDEFCKRFIFWNTCERSLMECSMGYESYVRYPLPGEPYNPDNMRSFWPLPDKLPSGYTPNGLAMCKSGAILVCLWNHKVHKRSLGKVLKLSLYGVKLFEMETDKNRPLLICPTYITENGNEDICVSDVNAVVVTDAGGFLRFRYTGTQSNPQFDPYGICCDSKNNIIVADMLKNRIHMIDQNGELLHFIQYQDMHMPRALCINKHDILYVGEWLSEEIKVLSLK